MTTVRETVAPRWMPPLLAAFGALLVPWTLLLAYRLPARHTSHHWDVAWVGFDVALAAALAATGLGIARGAQWGRTFATVAATLLLCDVWFDNVLASGAGEHFEALLEAVLVEVPLALVCLWLARYRCGPDRPR